MTAASSHATSGTSATTGDTSTPQPISTADANSGGANGACPGGPYCSTRNGSPSLNGRGDGVATGKPCAGCVGRADNKNPHGQNPNGTDLNAGYECDRNSGVGKTNPAHTGCAASVVPPVACVPTTEHPCGTSGGIVTVAQQPPHHVIPGHTPPTTTLPPRGAGAMLPQTGAPAALLPLLLGGLALAGMGLLLLRRTGT